MPIYIEDRDEIETLASTMQMVIDMENDMLFDSFPWNATTVRELAEKTDEEIRDELKDARCREEARLTKIEAARSILNKINKQA